MKQVVLQPMRKKAVHTGLAKGRKAENGPPGKDGKKVLVLVLPNLMNISRSSNSCIYKKNLFLPILDHLAII